MGAYSFLQQDEIWIDKEKVEHRIAEMEPSYCANVAGFLERQAQHLAAVVARELSEVPLPPSDTQAFAEVLADLDREADRATYDPDGWLRETPLMKALKIRAAEVA